MVTGTDRHRPRTIEGITRPDPSHHYGQIVAWIICWPWNLLWTLCVHNPFRYLFEFVVFEVRSTLDEIATGEFSKIERDLTESPVGSAQEMAPSTPRQPAGPTSLPAAMSYGETTSVQNAIFPEANPPSTLETIDEASFVGVQPAAEASADETTTIDQSALETLEETVAWETTLETSHPTAQEPNTQPSTASRVTNYTPPPMPEPKEEDPWYYFPPGKRHETN